LFPFEDGKLKSYMNCFWLGTTKKKGKKKGKAKKIKESKKKRKEIKKRNPDLALGFCSTRLGCGAGIPGFESKIRDSRNPKTHTSRQALNKRKIALIFK
jgi:hypothetical protein